jgi:hypothetical protein
MADESLLSIGELARMSAASDPRIGRYWQLTAAINGSPPFPSYIPAFEWLIAALRARG